MGLEFVFYFCFHFVIFHQTSFSSYHVHFRLQARDSLLFLSASQKHADIQEPSQECYENHLVQRFFSIFVLAHANFHAPVCTFQGMYFRPHFLQSVGNVAFYQHIKCQMCDVWSLLTPTIIVLDIRGYNRLAWGDTALRQAPSVYKLCAEEGFLCSNNASQFLLASAVNANAANAIAVARRKR